MYKLLEFLEKIYVFFLFLILEVVALSVFIESSIYTNAKISIALNKVSFGIQEDIHDFKTFFFLTQENERLNSELSELKNKLATYTKKDTLSNWIEVGDSTEVLYSYMPAKVVNNSYVKQNNYITINKGYSDGVEKDMSIIVGDNIVGYVLDCSENYSIGISMLNMKFNTSGRNSTGNYNGSITWNGIDITSVYMSEIPKYADIQIGDTIQTTSFSSRFPDGINIGTVKKIELINGIYYNAEINAFTDFSTLNNIHLVNFKDFKEKIELEQTVEQMP